MIGEYELECLEYGCKGRCVVQETMSVGWKVGKVVKSDPAEPNIIRCPYCGRNKMRVVRVPTFKKKVEIKGFSRLPKR